MAAGEARVVWRFLDGKPGHENQTKGLIQALSERTPVDLHEISAAARGMALLDWLRGHFAPGAALPGPDLLIGAGHRTHLPMLAARRAWGGRIVVLMKPSLPISLFDLCLIPMHDDPPQRDNVLLTRGVLNAVRNRGEHDPAAGLILVGGPSAHYHWDASDLIRQIEAVVHRDHRAWTLTTSRRTPAATTDALCKLRLPTLKVVPWKETDAEWVARELQRAARVWVSEDSVSMIYEALTSGAACGLLSVPQRRASRVSRGVRALEEEGLVVSFHGWMQGNERLLPAAPFDEAQRCAALIEQRCLDA